MKAKAMRKAKLMMLQGQDKPINLPDNDYYSQEEILDGDPYRNQSASKTIDGKRVDAN